MALSSGGKLGSYEIVSPLGAGGMGEVYRARDQKLAREVAIKVLPSEFAADAERMARFGREAQVLASLNHPNIAQIYGLEDSGGIRALVMELVEGQTLGERIALGAIPLDEALPIALQIAEALEFAHDRGIIHRDLKPANIKITPDGKVKVLDFGLAKALDDTPASANINTSPTISMAATRAGFILGTAAYMSPEQARAKPVDKRADIWSFGAVVFEMLAGRQAFAGEDTSHTMAAVIMNDPDWAKLPPSVPAWLRKLLKRCLTKDPRARLQAIGEARIAIEEAIAGKAEDSAERSAPEQPIHSLHPEPTSRRLLPWAIIAALAILAALGFWAPWRTQQPSAAPMRLSVEIGAPVSLAPVLPSAVISPDGERFVFAGMDANRVNQLYVRLRDQLQATPLPGTDGATDPFFSPDGQWIAFYVGGKLKKISVQGGAPVTLCDSQVFRGGWWSEDGTIIFAPQVRGGLSRVSSSGGTPQPVTTLDASKNEATHRWPQVLPGGKAVLFLAHSSTDNFEKGDIVVQVLKTGERKTVLQGGTFPRYMPAAPGSSTGYLIYAREGTLFAVPFDLDRLEVTGSPVPFLEHVAMDADVGSAAYTFSNSGTFLYMAGDSQGKSFVIDWMDKEGKLQPLRATPGIYANPRVSPDGKRLAIEVEDHGVGDIWVYDIARDTMSRITFGPGGSNCPIWTPDGQRIVFSSQRAGAGQSDLYWVRADGTGEVERLTTINLSVIPWSWSPDGRFLAFFQDSKAGKFDIWILPFEGDAKSGLKSGKPWVFLNSAYNEILPAISPDGHWLAYASNDTGKFEVYVRPFPGPGGKWQISNGGAVYPIWSKDGKELFYVSSSPSRIMVSTYRVAGESFQSDKAQVWSPGEPVDLGNASSFDLAPDGKRFAVLQYPESHGAAVVKNDEFVLILNATDELRRLTAANKQ